MKLNFELPVIKNWFKRYYKDLNEIDRWSTQTSIPLVYGRDLLQTI